MLFWLLSGIDAIAAAILLFFFFWGLTDGSVSDFNIGIWALLLGGVGAILGGGIWLRAQGRHHLANACLAVLALPAAGAGAFVLLLIILQPNWH